MEVKDAAGNVMYSDWGGTLAGFGPYLDFTEGSTYYFTVSTYMGQGSYTLAIE